MFDQDGRQAPPETTLAMWEALRSAVGRHLDRTKFADARRHLPLAEWDYLWDALAWSDRLAANVPLWTWLNEVGPCWTLRDRAREQATLLRPEEAIRLKRGDVYFVPAQAPDACFVSPHEAHLGPWLLPLSKEEALPFVQAECLWVSDHTR